VIVRRAALIIASLVALGFSRSSAAAQETTNLVRGGLAQIVAVRDVQATPDQVSGVLVNLSNKVIHDVRVLIDRSWLWTDERHPGPAEDNPGRAAVYAVPGEIPPGGQLPFTYRPDAPLPQRSDGRFRTSVSVASLEQVD
jgi:hypothetical protein